MKINLKDYYPTVYRCDFFIEVDEAVASAMRTERQERDALAKRIKRNKIVSLDEYGLKRKAIASARPIVGFSTDFGSELIMRSELLSVMRKLTPVQARRIFKHFYLGMSKVEIAQGEKVSASSVKDSIRLGLDRMRKLLE